jgi:Lon protease-like protein
VRVKPNRRLTLRLLTYGALLGILLSTPGIAAAQPSAAPDTLPSTIPLFPLQDATLFPNGSHGFYIFEPRYRAMVADALKGDRIIGMVTLQPGHEAEYEGRPPIFSIGCAGVIAAYEELPGGEYNIVLRGLAKFRVASEDNSRAYRLARVVPLTESLDADQSAALTEARERIAVLLTSLGVDPPPPDVPDVQVVDQIAQRLPVEPPERQRLLERDDALARASVVLEVLSRMRKAR